MRSVLIVTTDSVMTEQEAYDRVARGLKSQGFRRNVDADGVTCMYNGPDDRHCGVGWLIVGVELPETVPSSLEHADPVPANVAPIQSLVNVPAIAERLAGLDSNFLSQIQTAHDRAYDRPEKMKENLRSLAARRGLSAAVLDEPAHSAPPSTGA